MTKSIKECSKNKLLGIVCIKCRTKTALINNTEAQFMCNAFGNNSCTWIILLVIILIACNGGGDCGCGCNNGCGCN